MLANDVATPSAAKPSPAPQNLDPLRRKYNCPCLLPDFPPKISTASSASSLGSPSGLAAARPPISLHRGTASATAPVVAEPLSSASTVERSSPQIQSPSSPSIAPPPRIPPPFGPSPANFVTAGNPSTQVTSLTNEL